MQKSVDNTPVKGFASGRWPPLTGVLLRAYQTKGRSHYEDKTYHNASIPNQTRQSVYERDGYRCALCDDTRGLQIHHIIKRSCGGNDTPCNLITLCWRCHAEAHGTLIPERHPFVPQTPEQKWAAWRSLIDDYEQMCVEYVSDYYAERGEEWWPYK